MQHFMWILNVFKWIRHKYFIARIMWKIVFTKVVRMSFEHICMIFAWKNFSFDFLWIISNHNISNEKEIVWKTSCEQLYQVNQNNATQRNKWNIIHLQINSPLWPHYVPIKLPKGLQFWISLIMLKKVFLKIFEW